MCECINHVNVAKFVYLFTCFMLNMEHDIIWEH